LDDLCQTIPEWGQSRESVFDRFRIWDSRWFDVLILTDQLTPHFHQCVQSKDVIAMDILHWANFVHQLTSSCVGNYKICGSYLSNTGQGRWHTGPVWSPMITTSLVQSNHFICCSNLKFVSINLLSFDYFAMV
jgi:hypothetical protein